jgi:hypothetical protein
MNHDRRFLLKMVTGLLSSAALGEGAWLGAAEREALSELVGLRPGQEGWLTDLTAGEQEELRQALGPGGGGSATPRTVQLLARVLGRRSRLYAYLNYPQVEDQRSVCDGLMRE